MRPQQRQRILIFLVAIILWICFILINSGIVDFEDLWDDESHNNFRNPDENEVINLVLSLRGPKAVQRAMAMLKSMFYYQGRFDESRQECQKYLDKNSPCPPSETSLTLARTVIHVLTDNATLPFMKELSESWNLKYLQFQYYFVEKEIEKLSRIPNRHKAGVMPFLKLVVHNILPETIQKVALLDTDALFNANILWFWRHFEKFNANQSIGIATEQLAPYCKPSDNSPLPYYGINGGVVLYRLDRLRSSAFEDRWKRTLESFLKEHSSLPLGEQTLLNVVLNRWPEMYYSLPCAWNMQVYFSSTTECCPIIWPIRNPNERNCYKNGDRVAKLIHYNKAPKPDVHQRQHHKWIIPRNYENFLNVVQLRRRFAEASSFFKSIPKRCFN